MKIFPRMLTDGGTHARDRRTAIRCRRFLRMIAEEGEVEEKMMYNTYNMGIGMVLAVDPRRDAG